MITVTELWMRLDALATTLPAERVPLAATHGRVLGEAILAPEDQPPFDRSAIDGYLVHADQPAGPVTLNGTVPPGKPPLPAPALGTALRILTGSALPPENVALVMQEDTKLADDPHRLHLLQAPSTKHIRRRASQARAGDTLSVAGQRLNAGSLALLASIGATQPLVTRRARVAHLVTGGELVAPAEVPLAGQIRDSNSTLIAALLRDADANLGWHRRVANDSRSSTADALAEALSTDADVILISGGASVGDHDHTGSLLESFGFTIHCDKVASRPGKPFIAASRDGRLAFGLPGNPLSHFVCFHLFVKRALARLAGATPTPLVRATLAPHAELRPDPRETWWPCVWIINEDARRCVLPLPWRDSSDLTVLGACEGLLRVPALTGTGTDVDILPCR
jgi:molybdopterin molybdotransferase